MSGHKVTAWRVVRTTALVSLTTASAFLCLLWLLSITSYVGPWTIGGNRVGLTASSGGCMAFYVPGPGERGCLILVAGETLSITTVQKTRLESMSPAAPGFGIAVSPAPIGSQAIHAGRLPSVWRRVWWRFTAQVTTTGPHPVPTEPLPALDSASGEFQLPKFEFAFTREVKLQGPVWFVVLAFLALPIVLFLLGPLRRRGRRLRGQCERCAYDLTGLTEPRCPECGTAFEPAKLPRLEGEGTA